MKPNRSCHSNSNSHSHINIIGLYIFAAIMFVTIIIFFSITMTSINKINKKYDNLKNGTTTINTTVNNIIDKNKTITDYQMGKINITMKTSCTIYAKIDYMANYTIINYYNGTQYIYYFKDNNNNNNNDDDNNKIFAYISLQHVNNAQIIKNDYIAISLTYNSNKSTIFL